MNANPPQSCGLTAIDGAMAAIAVLSIVQIRLLSATLESYLAGHPGAALPGAVISGILFLAWLGLSWWTAPIRKSGAAESGRTAAKPANAVRAEPERRVAPLILSLNRPPVSCDHMSVVCQFR